MFDRETVRQFQVSLGWVLSDNFRVGQLPASLFPIWLAVTLDVAARRVYRWSLPKYLSIGFAPRVGFGAIYLVG